MMDSWMKKILLELNSISRVAVIEQAYGTEKMLRNYTKLLKYRWSYEGEKVLASMELTHLEMLLEYYQVKWRNGLTFQMNNKESKASRVDMKAVMIPHFTLCGTLVECMEEIQVNGMPQVHIQAFAEALDENLAITIVFEGSMNCQQMKEQLLNKSSTEYGTFLSARSNWMVQYGDDAVSVVAGKTLEEKENLTIQYVIIDAV